MNQLATPAAIVPASFAKRLVPLADKCFRDEGNLLLAADGSRYFLEWTPPIGVKERPSRAVLLQLCAECTLAGGGWDAPEVHEAITLVDYTQELPATHPELRAETPNDWMVTKTVDPSSPSDCAICVGFSVGSVLWYYQGYGGFVRAVRRVPASQ